MSCQRGKEKNNITNDATASNENHARPFIGTMRLAQEAVDQSTTPKAAWKIWTLYTYMACCSSWLISHVPNDQTSEEKWIKTNIYSSANGIGDVKVEKQNMKKKYNSKSTCQVV